MTLKELCMSGEGREGAISFPRSLQLWKSMQITLPFGTSDSAILSLEYELSMKEKSGEISDLKILKVTLVSKELRSPIIL